MSRAGCVLERFILVNNSRSSPYSRQVSALNVLYARFLTPLDASSPDVTADVISALPEETPALPEGTGALHCAGYLDVFYLSTAAFFMSDFFLRQVPHAA